jgi:hypothetical protein
MHLKISPSIQKELKKQQISKSSLLDKSTAPFCTNGFLYLLLWLFLPFAHINQVFSVIPVAAIKVIRQLCPSDTHKLISMGTRRDPTPINSLLYYQI